jgi:hypothetical protein
MALAAMIPQGAQRCAEAAVGPAPTYVMNLNRVEINLSPEGQELLREPTQEVQDLSRRTAPSRR